MHFLFDDLLEYLLSQEMRLQPLRTRPFELADEHFPRFLRRVPEELIQELLVNALINFLFLLFRDVEPALRNGFVFFALEILVQLYHSEECQIQHLLDVQFQFLIP